MSMVLTQITKPIALPVTLTDAKEELKITGTDLDQTVRRLMRSSTDRIERDTGQKLVTQSWQFYRNGFEEVMRIPFSPLQTVDSIMYIDSVGDWQTLSTSLYVVDNISIPGNVHRAYSAIWPVTRYIMNAVKITFTCGYGTPQQVPDRFVDMILLDMKMNFEPTEDKYSQTISDRLEGMIMRERLTWL